MTHTERQAQAAHPRLYALHQHGPIRFLDRLLWSRKALKAAKKRRSTALQPSAPRTRSQVIHIHVYAGAQVNV